MVGPVVWAWRLDGRAVRGRWRCGREGRRCRGDREAPCLVDAGLDDGEEFSVDRGFVAVVLKAGGGVGGADRVQRSGPGGVGVVGGAR